MSVKAEYTLEGHKVDYLPRVLAANATERGERTAMRIKRAGRWQDITWVDYYESARKVAFGLAALGVKPGDRVSIQSENRPEWMFVDMGASALRAAVVGFYPTNPATEITYLLQDSGTHVLFAEDQEQVDKALEAEANCPGLEWIVYIDGRGLGDHEHPKLISIDELIARGEALAAQQPGLLDEIDKTRTPDDIVTLVYTSGTTGPPKGGMLSARNVSYASSIFKDTEGPFGGVADNDVLLSYLPLSHVAERVFSTWLNLQAHTVLHFAESIETVTADLAEVQPTILFAVPRIWEKIQAGVVIKMSNATRFKRAIYTLTSKWSQTIAEDRIANQGEFTTRARLLYWLGYWPMFRPLRKRLGLLKVNYGLTGAAPIAPEVIAFFLGLGLSIYEVYGMTENSAIATSNYQGRMLIGTVGEPQPGCEIKLAEGTNEVLTRSLGNFVGYLNKPEATAEVLIEDGWLRTGDVGEWVNGTHLRIVDRIKDIIITAGGKNISPSEIENSIKVSPFVKEAVVIGDKKPYLVAIIGIEYDTVADWAQRRNIEFTTYRDLSTKPEVIELISEVVRGTNAKFARVESIRKFRMMTKELDHEDGELTATQKLKRQAFAATVPFLIDDMYSDSSAYPGADLGRNG